MKHLFLKDLEHEYQLIEQTRYMFKHHFGELIKSVNPSLSSSLFTVQQEMNYLLSVLETRHKQLINMSARFEQIALLRHKFASKLRVFTREQDRFNRSSRRLSNAIMHTHSRIASSHSQRELENASRDEIAQKRIFDSVEAEFRVFREKYSKDVAMLLCETLCNCSSIILESNEVLCRGGAEIQQLMHCAVESVDDALEKQELLALKRKYKQFN